jgi:DNA-nicking Smr family endonuclease
VQRVPIEDEFDLHSFRPQDIRSVVGEYLGQATIAGFRQVRLIHGKGIGVRRAEVRLLLSRRPDVEAFFDAPPERGGMGATVVILKGSRTD